MRYGIASAMATVAVLLTLVAGPGWFAKSTLYDTDTVVDRVDAALDDERVQVAIADSVTDHLFQLAGIDREAASESTGEADPDTTPEPSEASGGEETDVDIATTLQTAATEQAEAIVASDRLDPQILAAVRIAHEVFLDIANRTPDAETDGGITIDLQPIVTETLAAIGDDPTLSFLGAVESDDADRAAFVVFRDGQGGGVWWSILRSFPDWTNLTIFGIFVLLGSAIVLSPERDRIMLSSGLGIATIALIIAAMAWAARVVVATVFIRDEIARGAFEAVYDVLSKPLIGLEIRIAIFAAVMAAAGGILGFYLDWKAERILAEEADDPYGHDQPLYRSPYGETGIPPGPQR